MADNQTFIDQQTQLQIQYLAQEQAETAAKQAANAAVKTQSLQQGNAVFPVAKKAPAKGKGK